ncbi:MAG TPA: SH3 domain-containing protein [Streptosporangiaceae bacterium]
MGKVRTSTGLAFAVAGLAASGFTLFSSVPAQAAAVPTGTFQVTASSGLNVRKGPGTNFGVITALKNGTKIRATCQLYGTSHNWRKIFEPVTYNGKHIRGGYVSNTFLKRLSGCVAAAPSGAVATGGGGTSQQAGASPALPAAGLALITLGSAVAIATGRRRPEGQS